MRKKRLLTVSVGISAFNEELNIRNLLQSIVTQKTQQISIEEIIVISDASTDATVKKIQAIKDKRIRLIDAKKRLGKPQRLNQLFKMAHSDVLTICDGDTIMASSTTIENLVKPFQKNPNLGLTCGLAKPVKGKTFIENAVNASVHAYLHSILELQSSDSAYVWEGRLFALSKKFAQICKLPQIAVDDIFIYLFSKEKKFGFQWVPSAEILFRSPANIQEQIKQHKRYLTRKKEFALYFKNDISHWFFLPKTIFYKHLFLQLMKNPMYCFAIFFINSYGKYFAKQEQAISSHWTIAASTKGNISYE